MIIDTHAHIYPDKIAPKASKSIEDFYDLAVENNGTVARLLELGERAKIDRFIVHSVATTPAQVQSINNFIIGEVNAHQDKFIGFATLHPDYEDIEGEIQRVIDSGLKGIKLHPDFQKYNIDDEKACRMYEAAEGRLTILFHMGDKRTEFSKPERLARIIEKYPKLEVIGAHFAGFTEWDHAASVLGGSGIYVDSSSSFAFMAPEHARELIDAFGADRVLFASDYPMWSPEDELERLSRIQLTEEERELILHGNAQRLIGM